MSAIKVEDVRVRFGGVKALDGVSLEIEHGQVTGLIGPNGAGKSTLLNCMSGICRMTSGSIRFEERQLAHMRPDLIARLGVARTFQHAGLIETLTVRQNVELGDYSRQRPSMLRGFSELVAHRQLAGDRRERGQGLLERLGLEAVAERPPSGLAQGVLRMVEVARALMADPRLLLLDEPAAGLTHAESLELSTQLRKINENDGVTMIVVEHNMGVIEAMCDRVHVMHLGKTLFTGTPSDVASEPSVVEAYLGIA